MVSRGFLSHRRTPQIIDDHDLVLTHIDTETYGDLGIPHDLRTVTSRRLLPGNHG